MMKPMPMSTASVREADLRQREDEDADDDVGEAAQDPQPAVLAGDDDRPDEVDEAGQDQPDADGEDDRQQRALGMADHDHAGDDADHADDDAQRRVRVLAGPDRPGDQRAR